MPKRRDKGFEEHLNYWLPLCDNPTILGFKGGEFFRAWDLFGPDLRYASEEERARLSAIQGQAFRLVSDNGWVLQRIGCVMHRPGIFRARSFPTPHPRSSTRSHGAGTPGRERTTSTPMHSVSPGNHSTSGWRSTVHCSTKGWSAGKRGDR